MCDLDFDQRLVKDRKILAFHLNLKRKQKIFRPLCRSQGIFHIAMNIKMIDIFKTYSSKPSSMLIFKTEGTLNGVRDDKNYQTRN